MSETSELPNRLFVVSAPSGTGKTTLNRRLSSTFEEVSLAVSHTTRAIRDGEKDGVHYHFVSVEQVKQKIINEDFLEWAEVHRNFYGTSLGELRRLNDLGQIPILEIDVQGWLLCRPKIPDALAVFILPPTLEDLWKRLKSRGTDSLETIWLRLQNAYREIEIASNYNYFIVNDSLDAAFDELKSIVIDGQRGKINEAKGQELCEKLKEEYKNADWIQGLRAQIQC